MSTQGILLIDFVAFGLILLTLNLLRSHMLTLGYAFIWLVALVGIILIVSIPQLMGLITILVGAIFPASAISLVAFVFIFVVLIFFSVQISIMSKRQVDLIQSIAMLELSIEEYKTEREKTENAHG
jgi:hypothetical protein